MEINASATNERDSASEMGDVGKNMEGKVSPGRVDQLNRGSKIPEYTTFKDYSVFSGGKGLDQKDYMQSTFHTSALKEGDVQFKHVANLLQDEAGTILNESRRFRTAEDIGEEEDLDAQEKEAAL